ncbi:hypothetical protein A3B05_01810 [Candidatus Giovannonibacteria bacterium RIFCSPLOWO2_01_FULL_43_160]|uniref:Uncharacterized protein n=2 Tax=Candidatus Giovannoniibacteriota TaxID=1752738 RepID=A0A0G1LVB4_9BACT|nr:MAG: hypothetical protein UV72_C0002G0143 [Candidatus Giovannonibacteria bacterium GW2011_GWB1_43_13]KKS99933.1 MAG: hypothetical protein UV75_C0001G0098 [Candidatus Giovannonibacteria bacterium GW2011_GWA1_43_15]KKT21007.1 MAG: hypothetical protein UW05_C0020G0002 [Candidatus Giovannonibacteria bacterium GW2011_GWC2_43_8]KKT63634.1 MAG: hypothetical protein UW55_C0002G0099 [Candidatus Giovannonibacteria bacterium GW2011_GWA2_44_26]OGF58490.1 MAG: hypothetical protein A2652_01760 [Candidatus
MKNLTCLMVLRPDGLVLTVKVSGDKIIADVHVANKSYDPDSQELLLEIHEKSYSQEFDLVGISWQPKCNEELLVKFLRVRIEKSAFRNFAKPIIQLAQKIAELNGGSKQAAA